MSEWDRWSLTSVVLSGNLAVPRRFHSGTRPQPVFRLHNLLSGCDKVKKRPHVRARHSKGSSIHQVKVIRRLAPHQNRCVALSFSKQEKLEAKKIDPECARGVFVFDEKFVFSECRDRFHFQEWEVRFDGDSYEAGTTPGPGNKLKLRHTNHHRLGIQIQWVPPMTYIQ